ncbi:thioesterase domain-containing protein [Streptomyces sp. CB02923]|uniref:thioesterase domain-containing protein n=1 Tax=Streptomyces sp. CB02923 TaxID=1718985 RepID=UPI0009A117EC|nr:thioesterase domain-containing protein [Streptomyces sp. CB02923]
MDRARPLRPRLRPPRSRERGPGAEPGKGRQDRRGEQPIGTVAAMADQLAAALRPWTDVPFAFFGHNMGAVPAYETALRLEKDGIRRPPAGDQQAPGRPHPRHVLTPSP